MCRNIKVLFNFEPPATSDEVRAAALQYVRKVTGTTGKRPAKANEAAFDHAVEQVAEITAAVLEAMETNAPTKNREVEAQKRKAASAKRFAR